MSLLLWGCPTKITQTGDLTEIYFRLFWWMGIQKQGVGRLGLSWSPSPAFADDRLPGLSSCDFFAVCKKVSSYVILWWHWSYWVRVLHLWPHLNVIISLKARSPSTVILGGKASTFEFGKGNKIQSIIVSISWR